MKLFFKKTTFILSLLPYLLITSCSDDTTEPVPCSKEAILEEYSVLGEEIMESVGSCKETRDSTQKFLDFMLNNKECLVEALAPNEHQKDLIENNINVAIESLTTSLEDLNVLVDNGSCK